MANAQNVKIKRNNLQKRQVISCLFCCDKKHHRTSAPKGSNANNANLKCCKPKGIPMIVIQQIIPATADITANSQPQKIIQKTFKTIDPPDILPYTISFPKGDNTSFENLKHCNPMGIPMIVIKHNTPAKHNHMAQIRPPNNKHIILPSKLIILLPPFLFIICYNIKVLLIVQGFFSFF